MPCATARDKLEPARIAFGSGVSFANINRRAKDVDGRVSLGLNPDGPVDRQINLIRLDRPDGRLIALIANYAMHGTVMSGQNLKISGDGPGTVTAYLEDKLGGHGSLHQRRGRQHRADLLGLPQRAERSPVAVQGSPRRSDPDRAGHACAGHGECLHATRGTNRRDAAQRWPGMAAGARRICHDW